MDVLSRAQVEGRPAIEQVEVGLQVSSVVSDGIGEAIGIVPGDMIELINDEPIRDPIDYRFHLGDENIVVQVRRGDDVFLFDIEKDADDDLGVTFDDMPILKCDNKCVFCFLHQMPKGMRKTLYYQDDDYRLSFLHGAYVTLTNLSEDEFQRIIEQRLSPMYISVHATDPALRAELLGRKQPTPVLDRIDTLASHGIQMHTQVVLCPGLNDGQHLKQTVFDLAERHPHIESVGVVPLGLTKYRKNLPELNPVTPDDARDVVQQVAQWQAVFQKRLGTRFVYLGDEFYFLAGQEPPPQSAYDGFPLLENGIGMVRRFTDLFDERIGELSGFFPQTQQFILVTGMLGAHFLTPMVNRLQEVPRINAQLIPVVNRFLGEGITVSGLLAGQDILAALNNARPAREEIVLLPPNCVNHNGVFLDDMAPADLAEKLGCRVVVGTYDLVETLMNAASDISKNPDSGSDVMDHPYISSHQVEY